MSVKIMGVERELHNKVLSHVSFGLKDKCWFCKNKDTTNKIMIWNRQDTLRLCSNCSIYYTNKDFTKLLEVLITGEKRK